MKSKKSVIIACVMAVVILLLLTAFSADGAIDPEDNDAAYLMASAAVSAEDIRETAEGETGAETAGDGQTEPETAGDEQTEPETREADSQADRTAGAEADLTDDGILAGENAGTEEIASAGEVVSAVVLKQEEIGKEAAQVLSAEVSQAEEEAAVPETEEAAAAVNGADEAAADQWILAGDELKKEYTQGIFLITVTGNTALNVREEPTTDSDWVGKMYEGSGGQVLETGDGWTKIQSGKVTGWVSNDYILSGEEAAAVLMEEYELIFEVTSDALKVRSEPTTEVDNKIRAIYGGETYEVISVQQDWVQIEYSKEKYGWVAAEYGTIHYEYDDAMTKKEYQDYVTSKNHVTVSTTTRSATSASTDDLTLLACLIQCESGSYEGMLAVANVVINRVNSSRYPNTISEVIYAAGQFSPASSGKLDTRLSKGPSSTAIQAATDALNGTNNIGSYLHFRSSKTADLSQYSAYTIVAGNVFY